jgi:hypothetical protein
LVNAGFSGLASRVPPNKQAKDRAAGAIRRVKPLRSLLATASNMTEFPLFPCPSRSKHELKIAALKPLNWSKEIGLSNSGGTTEKSAEDRNLLID